MESKRNKAASAASGGGRRTATTTGDVLSDQEDDAGPAQQQWIEATATAAVPSDPASKKKWRCGQCTYENWPSSLKCVICLASKSSSPQRSTLSSSAAAAAAAAAVASSGGKQHQRKIVVPSSSPAVLHTKPVIAETTAKTVELIAHDHLGKWSCPQCTYLNWPKSAKCVQCYTPKSSVSTSDQPGTHDLMNPEQNSLKTVFTSSPKNSPLNRSLCSSPCTVPVSQKPVVECGSEPTSDATIETVAAKTNPVELKKWSCSACTYQNWPKSQRCVMCLVPRHANLASVASSSSTASTSTTNRVMINLKEQKLQPHQTPQQVMMNVSSYQIQIDRLFLAACEGVVDGNMGAMNRYVGAGGDLTRYLTSDECKLLNRPNVFKVGLTLLHLCYQFKRKEFLLKLLNHKSNYQQQSQQPSHHYQAKVINTLIKQVIC